MDFIDWRKLSKEQRETAQHLREQKEFARAKKIFHGIADYHIQRAQDEGLFDNLAGAGKPFSNELLYTSAIHDLANSIIKSVGGEPREISLRKDIQRKCTQLEKECTYLTHRLQYLQSLKVGRFPRRIKNFQREVHNCEQGYQKRLQEINSRILTLNMIAPSQMHMQILPIEELLAEYRQRFYIFDER